MHKYKLKPSMANGMHSPSPDQLAIAGPYGQLPVDSKHFITPICTSAILVVFCLAVHSSMVPT